MTRFRIVSTLFLALFIAPAVFAAHPSARFGTRMVYDPNIASMVLYGGQTAFDAGTAKAYDLDETWFWTGERWVQAYPAHNPGPRSFHTMVYDLRNRQVILFGGKTATTDLNDTWTFDGRDWTKLDTIGAPSPRLWMGSTYDRKRGVVILYGGQFTDPTKTTNASTVFYDTWEYNIAANTWTQVGSNGPQVTTPLLAYDASRDTTYMLGTNSSAAPKMYTYNSTNGTWSELTPSTMPDCVADGGLVYRDTDAKLVVYGGTCTSSTVNGETFEWDGTNWTHISPSATTPRLSGEALAYDLVRNQVTAFGGTEAFGSVQSRTFTYKNGLWATAAETSLTPVPRSLFAFVTDPVHGNIWLFGGQNDNGVLADLWKYHDGQWESITADNTPSSCVTPNGVWDIDRQKLVIVCSDSSVHEFDGTAWTNLEATTFKTKPQARRFSAATYDQSLKKTILFAGFNETVYLDETWLWDGTTWTQVKGDSPYDRSHAAMWYDKKLGKTLIFGGIGQQSRDSRIERFADMWSFDGKNWTQMKSITATPGPRYGVELATAPDGKVLLFGGMKLVVNGASQSQVYANDLWQWDGSAWTQINTDSAPPVRENAGFAYDPTTNEYALFAGWAGLYRSDLWSLRGTSWILHNEDVPTGIQNPTPSSTGRRRSVLPSHP